MLKLVSRQIKLVEMKRPRLCDAVLLFHGLTRVVCRTLQRRGKSETPWSRIETEESRRLIEDCSDDTADDKEVAMITGVKRPWVVPEFGVAMFCS